ncbi:hypothetical protein L914_00001 [Phytophthora nicotianae]|uniref:Uncharacterized protein n=2 Tax=Phytophthora nicotianae TaxID=4792 RepID=V9G2L5_PHYNI|nr:hypothetical protein F443_00003 [Phytophthora nicotianae P1569]ETM57119.1 hypothetical protein L914_00001 [Phytophthora nicotianae]
MCELDFERIDTDKGTRLTLIDAESGVQFKSIRVKFQRLDELRRKQYVFHLTLWDLKKKKGSGSKERFRVGGVYEFRKIHSVHYFAEAAQGSLQSIDPGTDNRVQEVSVVEGNKRRSMNEGSSTIQCEDSLAMDDDEAKASAEGDDLL